MCLATIARVEATDGASATVRDGSGRIHKVSLLLLEGQVERGDHLAVQFGHAVAVLDPAAAAEATALQQQALEPDHARRNRDED